MYLIVGLGNPGKQYAVTRHNIGFMVIDELVNIYQGEDFKEKYKAFYSEITVNYSKILLVKPQTYMNNSGIAISQFVRFYKIPLSKLIVIHDDLDLKLSMVKAKIGGRNAGHNGLKNIDAMVGKDYHRIRIGIDHPRYNSDINLRNQSVSSYVLEKFSSQEEKLISETIYDVAHNIDSYLAH